MIFGEVSLSLHANAKGGENGTQLASLRQVSHFLQRILPRAKRNQIPVSRHCFLKVPCPANQLKLHENSYFSRKCLTRRNSYVTMFGRMEDIGLFFMLKNQISGWRVERSHTKKNGGGSCAHENNTGMYRMQES